MGSEGIAATEIKPLGVEKEEIKSSRLTSARAKLPCNDEMLPIGATLELASQSPGKQRVIETVFCV